MSFIHICWEEFWVGNWQGSANLSSYDVGSGHETIDLIPALRSWM